MCYVQYNLENDLPFLALNMEQLYYFTFLDFSYNIELKDERKPRKKLL